MSSAVKSILCAAYVSMTGPGPAAFRTLRMCKLVVTYNPHATLRESQLFPQQTRGFTRGTIESSRVLAPQQRADESSSHPHQRPRIQCALPNLGAAEVSCRRRVAAAAGVEPVPSSLLSLLFVLLLLLLLSPLLPLLLPPLLRYPLFLSPSCSAVDAAFENKSSIPPNLWSSSSAAKWSLAPHTVHAAPTQLASSHGTSLVWNRVSHNGSHTMLNGFLSKKSLAASSAACRATEVPCHQRGAGEQHATPRRHRMHDCHDGKIPNCCLFINHHHHYHHQVVAHAP